jgi:hypothetical protein
MGPAANTLCTESSSSKVTKLHMKKGALICEVMSSLSYHSSPHTKDPEELRIRTKQIKHAASAER